VPAYSSSPFRIGKAFLSGIPAYSFGAAPSPFGNLRFQVTSVAISGSNVATIGVILREGLLPSIVNNLVGALISVQGTQTPTSGGAPNFNVTQVAISALTIDSTTGVGTISFALTSSTISTTPDSGQAIVQAVETGDAMTSDASGQQFAMQSQQGFPSNSRDLNWVIATPSAPSSFTAYLQVADVDQDAEYTTIDTTTAVGKRVVIGVRANFVRIALGTVSGGSSPTVVGKIME
jgi:hypothetical protein